MHKFIERSNTGTPEMFAKRLGISQSRLYKIIEEMKDMGAPIDYSRKMETYYYVEDFEINVTCSLKRLSVQEKETISAGCTNVLNFSFTAFFV
jgi:predicted DNA-binding transcriptional regulator YafY